MYIVVIFFIWRWQVKPEKSKWHVESDESLQVWVKTLQQPLKLFHHTHLGKTDLRHKKNVIDAVYIDSQGNTENSIFCVSKDSFKVKLSQYSLICVKNIWCTSCINNVTKSLVSSLQMLLQVFNEPILILKSVIWINKTDITFMREKYILLTKDWCWSS